ncbi:hypothetical protein ACPCG0_08350 [Propionibacteriaceae bacterium Y1923]|uniref:hypothetical protein n=1 Tax=Aestuariimicrobium sp. Y1814 TaxID=3418742 RepID=UPI003C1342A6
MTLLLPRLAVLLNSMDAGRVNPSEAEHALAGQVHLVEDPEQRLGLGHHPTLRLAMAQMPRLPGPGGWVLALVTPGRLGGLRGPAALNQSALASVPEPELGAVAVVLRHDGLLAWQAAAAIPEEESVDEEVLSLVLSGAERPLSPATPTEAGRQLAQVMAASTAALEAMAVAAGRRPDPAATVQLGGSYPASSQVLLDQAMTVLAVVEAAHRWEAELPHSHAVTSRSGALASLRAAALDAVQAAVSWPTHLMV